LIAICDRRYRRYRGPVAQSVAVRGRQDVRMGEAVKDAPG
jgi:hypothetical protein